MSRNVIKLVQGDTLPEIVVLVKDDQVDDAGNVTTVPVDLTDVAVATMKIRKLGSLTLTDTLTGQVLSPLGQLKFTFSPLSLATAGAHQAEIELTMLGGAVFTLYDILTIRIRPQF